MSEVIDIPEGYKKTKVGVIPEDWEVKLLESISKRGSGHTPNKKVPNYYNGGIKWVSLADSSRLDNGIIDKTEIEISSEGIKNSSAVLHTKGTVLISRDAGVGKSAIMGEDMAVSQHFITWTCDGLLSNWYLYYHLQFKKGLFERMAVGSTIKTIGLSFFKKFQVPYPPLPEQQKIAAILGTWDKAIEHTQDIIGHLRLRNKGLAQQLLTGKTRLKGFGGEWNQYHFSELLKKIKRPVEWNDEELYNLISVRRRSGGIFLRENLYGHQIKVKDLRTAKEGDFLFSKMQIVHGASALVTSEFDNTKISGSYIAVVSKDPKILSMEYFNWYSKLPYFYHQTFVSSYGVHIEKMTFNFNLFLHEKIELPSEKEQLAIVDVLRKAEKELQLFEKKLVTLQEQKKGLMQKLLTGEIRVHPVK